MATTAPWRPELDFLQAQDGGEQVDLLAVRNPAAILEDGADAPVPPLRIRQSWMQPDQRVSGGEQ